MVNYKVKDAANKYITEENTAISIKEERLQKIIKAPKFKPKIADLNEISFLDLSSCIDDDINQYENSLFDNKNSNYPNLTKSKEEILINHSSKPNIKISKIQNIKSKKLPVMDLFIKNKNILCNEKVIKIEVGKEFYGSKIRNILDNNYSKLPILSKLCTN